MATTFLEGVNQVLRIAGIIGSDNESVISFSDTQHAEAVQKAKLAIKDEYAYLLADFNLPQNKFKLDVAMIAGQRAYKILSRVHGDSDNLARLYNTKPKIYIVENGSVIDTTLSYYSGGEEQLQKDFPRYRTQQGTPTHYYFASHDISNESTMRIGLYQVPTTWHENNWTMRIYDIRDRYFNVEADLLPFERDIITDVFLQAATIRFKWSMLPDALQKSQYPSGINADRDLLAYRSTVLKLNRPAKVSEGYGRVFIG